MGGVRGERAPLLAFWIGGGGQCCQLTKCSLLIGKMFCMKGRVRGWPGGQTKVLSSWNQATGRLDSGHSRLVGLYSQSN